jgi:hypothetical protein
VQTNGALAHQDLAAIRFAAEAVSRNRDILTGREQAVLRSATVLVAGCGSVGGAVVEPLARLGVIRLRLADPDQYDVTNLNRQAGVLADVGRSKPQVLAERVLAINPFAQPIAYREGLTLDNLDAALDGAHIAFDGIDPGMSGWVKYQLHERAARRGIPVLAGADFGGKPVVYVFDYRRDATPFHGRATAQAHRDGDVWESLRWFGRSHFPSDFLPVMADRWRNGGDWPQISYCVLGMGALGSRAIIDVLMGRRVRRVITTDFHAATKPTVQAIAHRVIMPWRLAKTLQAIRQRRRAATPPSPSPSPPRSPAAADRLSPLLATILDGARSAPSAHHSQPWRFHVPDDTTVRLVADLRRWPATGPRGNEWATSLGCALGVMSYLSRGEWVPAGTPPTGDGWCAGTLHVEGPGPDAIVRQGVVGARVTMRAAMLTTPVDTATLDHVTRIAAGYGVAAEIVAERRLLDRMAGAVRFSGPGPEDGLDRPALRLAAQWVARAEVRSLRDCGALVVLRGRSGDAADRITAGAALTWVWLRLVEAGYAAQPLHGEFAGRWALDGIGAVLAPAAGGQEILAVLRVGRASAPASNPIRRPLAEMVI